MKIKHLFLLISSMLILSIAVIFSVFLYITHKKALLDGIDKKLLTAAYCTEEILPKNYHDRIVDKESVAMDEYLEIVDRYNKFCIKLGLQYVWSLMIVENQIVFTSGTSTGKDVTKGDHALFFDLHTNPSSYKEAFNTMDIQYSSFHDKWGDGRMVLVPKYDKHGRRYLLASSMSIGDLNTLIRKTMINSITISLIVLLAGLIASFILSSFLSKPIIRLTEVARDIASGNLHHKIQVRGSSELIDLSKSIEVMSISIREKIEEIEEKNIALKNDIIERKKIENALKESEKKYRSVYDTAPLAFVVWDKECNIQEWNDQAEKIFGYSRKEVLGHNFFDLIIPDIEKAMVEQVVENLLNGKLDTHVINQNITKSKNLIWCEWNNAIVKDAEGHITAALSLGLDITDRVKAEEELKDYRQHLEELVEKRTAELKSKNKELETFTYSVSHDLKAPLRGIDGYSRLLTEEYSDKLDEEGLGFLDNVRKSTEQMTQLIEDLLAYSRMERRSIQTTSIDFKALIEMLTFERQHDIDSNHIQIDIKLPFDYIQADADTFRQVLGNYLDNAIKFSRKQGQALVEIGGNENDTVWTIWVKDNGIGFDSKYHDRIFQIFQRLHRTEDYQGTGVGLAIVRKAVERIGGRVWAESVLGEGATFFLEIPKNEHKDEKENMANETV